MSKLSAGTRAAAAAGAAAAASVLENDRTATLDGEGESPELIEEVLGGLRQLEGAEQMRWRITCTAPLRNRGVVETLRTDELQPELFAERYGPGEYRIAGFSASGQYIRGASSVIRISELAARASAPRETESAAPQGTPWMQQWAAEQDRRERERIAARKELMIALGGPLITAAASLAASIISRPSIQPELIAALRPQSNLGELTTALTNLDTLRGKGGNGDTLDTVLALAERLAELPAGKGGDEGWVGVIRDVVRDLGPAAKDFVGELKQARAEARAAQARGQSPSPPQTRVLPGFAPPLSAPPTGSAAKPAQSSAPIPSTAPTMQGIGTGIPPTVSPSPISSPAPPSLSEHNPMLDRVLPWLHRQADNVQDWAASDLDPAECAELLLETVPAHFRVFLTTEQLQTLLQRPDWWDVLVQFHPTIAEHKAWVEEGYAELLSIIAEEVRLKRRNGAAEEAAPLTDPPASTS